MASHRADGSAFRRPRRSRPRRVPARVPAHAPRRHRLAWTRRLPQAGVVGVLGVATIVAPLAGDVLPTAGHAAEARPPAPSETAAPPVQHFRILPVQDQAADVPDSVASRRADVPTAEELAAAREAAHRASRELERRTVEQERLAAAMPDCDPTDIDVGAANGRLRTGDMCDLWGTGHLLRADAAMALARLSFAFEDHFGYDMVVTDSYRSYGAQVNVAARKPGLAARPGTSEHGWGLAVDFAGGVEVADHHYTWLLENAPAFGWDNPAWARKGGSGPYEPWHFEYVAGQPAGG